VCTSGELEFAHEFERDFGTRARLQIGGRKLVQLHASGGDDNENRFALFGAKVVTEHFGTFGETTARLDETNTRIILKLLF
jgi:hypothetical protein